MTKKKCLFILLVFTLAGYFLTIPRRLFNDPVSTVILDKNGQLLGARVAEDEQWRFPMDSMIPEKVSAATIVYEDRFFYRHPGFNPVSMLRAVFKNAKAGKIVQGGSTLTMQTIRLSRKGKPRTVLEKLIETIKATQIEIGKSKREILALYLANAPYGGNVVGVEAASWRYFGVSATQLSWAEAATLAVLPNSPALVHPGRNKKILLMKRNKLLERLKQLGRIDSLTLSASLMETIPDTPVPMPQLAPHLLNRLCIYFPGQIIKTTIDIDLQTQLSKLAERHNEKLKTNEIYNLAAIVIEVETGNILAYVGNCGYGNENMHGNEVDIIQSERSTGSLLKPILYAAMLDDGRILPESLIPDIPINMNGFAPQNFDGQFEGAIKASQALSRSLNVPAVQLLRQYGVERFHHVLKALGMNTIDQTADYYGLSLILGGAEGNLEEMTNVYASFTRVLNHYANSGLYYASDYRQSNFLSGKNNLAESGITEPKFFNASSIWFTYNAMIEVNRPAEESDWKQFGSSRKIAWKTGTSFGYRDGWAIGTTPEYVVGVWTGNADGEGRPGLTGISCAAPMMFDVFGLLPSSEDFPEPTDELVSASVCRISGYLAGPDCPNPDTVKIQVNGLKAPVCPYHKTIHLTGDNQYQVSSDCYATEKMNHLSWFVLPPIQEWYYKKHHSDYRSLPPYKDGCKPAGGKSMDLIYPREEVTVYIPKELNGARGRVIFEAVHTDPEATIYWHLDDQYITATKFIHQVELLPDAGDHTLILVDQNGEEYSRHFRVAEP